MANEPIKREKVGNGVWYAIFENHSEKTGSWLNVKITRSYRDKQGEYQDTTSFRRDDLLFVAKAADMAFEWCLKHAEASKKQASNEE